MNRKLTILTICIASLLFASLSASAQSSKAARKQALVETQDFKLAKYTETFISILSELNVSYVDSLPLDRMRKASLNAMLEVLDPYTVYVPSDEKEDFSMMLNKSYGGMGAIIYKPEISGNIIINEPYANSPAANAGLRCTDEILEINGESTHGLSSSESSAKLRGKPGTTIKLKVRKTHGGETWAAGDTLDLNITRKKIHLPDVEYFGMVDDTTGYVLQTGFTDGVANEVSKAFLALKKSGMKRFILDLRGNGGGLLTEAANIVSLFVPQGSLVVTARGKGDSTVYKTRNAPIDLEMPITILVDSGSASASEIVSGALQDYDRATIMGYRTFGKGLVQSIRSLPYGDEMKVTTAKYYTPSGRCVQAIDYSNLNEDGSVGHIPDSLTHEFRTVGGRIVKDGGGITPDVQLSPRKAYPRIVYSLVLSGVVDRYSMHYVRSHSNIPDTPDFHFTDVEDFISFASNEQFDYRSEAKTWFDKMKSTLEEEGRGEELKDILDTLEKAIQKEKTELIEQYIDSIIPFIEEEIAVRYGFQSAGVQIRLRYDNELKEALAKPSAI